MVTVNGCVKVRKGRADVWEKDWICTNQDLETTKQIRGEQGVSGILKRGRQGHATLCLSLDTAGTDCCDYKSELTDRVPESARRNPKTLGTSCIHIAQPHGTF